MGAYLWYRENDVEHLNQHNHDQADGFYGGAISSRMEVWCATCGGIWWPDFPEHIVPTCSECGGKLSFRKMTKDANL